jgi:hypothetical protein
MSNAGNFNGHADAVVQCGTQRPMEHILGFTRSHWMPPLGKYLHRIALSAAMVDELGAKHKTLKNLFYLATIIPFYSQTNLISGPKMDPLLSSLMRHTA